MGNKFRVLVALLFTVSLLFSIQSSAQTKFGHVDYSTIITNMPGFDSIQKVLVKFHEEQQIIYEEMTKEFNDKYAAFEKLSNTPNTSPSVLKIRKDELGAMYKKIKEFEDSIDAEFQDKQDELQEPFQMKLIDAIKKVAKANHYSYIFDISTLMYYTQSDDLTEKVKAELGIK